jgi:phospholipid/cholesterol/gamma-HCH transport system substrate-binding protein
VTSEAKTGIVLLVVVAAAIASWAKLGGLSRFREYEVIVCFDDLHGLPKGAPVRLRGVDIGKVTSVDVGMDPELGCLQARAILSISRKQPLYRKDKFQVASGSLFGDRHILVTRGGGPMISMDEVEVVKGSPPAGLDAITTQADDIAGQLGRIMDGLESVIGDEQVQGDLKEALANLKVLSERSTQVATRALSLVEGLGPESADKVNTLVDNLYEVSRSLRLTAAEVRAFVSTTTMPDDMKDISANLVATSESVRATTATIEELVSDPKTSSKIRTTLDNVEEATARGSEAAAKATEVLDKVDRVVGRVDRAMGSVEGIGRSFDNIETEAAFDFRWGSGPAGRMDLDLDVFPNRYRDGFWRVGVRDIGGSEKLDLQRGLPLSRRGEALRVGLIEGELGVGYDRQWSRRWLSEADIIDPDKFRLDVRAHYRYDPDWDLVFGMDRVFSGSEPFVGARRHFDF